MRFFFQAEDGIRYLVRSRGLGDVYKRQKIFNNYGWGGYLIRVWPEKELFIDGRLPQYQYNNCLLYTSDAADERSSVDLGGRRIIKKQRTYNIYKQTIV